MGIMNNNYKVGQIITLEGGFVGRVKSVCHNGNCDIRAPYHLSGAPKLEGINGNFGYIKIIPDSWEILYGGEAHESEVVKID